MQESGPPQPMDLEKAMIIGRQSLSTIIYFHPLQEAVCKQQTESALLHLCIQPPTPRRLFETVASQLTLIKPIGGRLHFTIPLYG
ncbi:conserved hypothetical protein [Ricinus communis]|uniref:Uncharacterized protein n=1 Tax=Ricinus communis TaxID=3988 RepID=B9SUB0_RICCO|nr:conserved hypothetical protein [Ricinus communis]